MPPDGRRFLDPRTLEKITRLELRARLVVEGFITGQHRSPYHGFAVEFASHREYVPGDEIKHIDWKVWARQDRLYIKEYEEETNLTCTLLLDASRSMAYAGTDRKTGWSKFQYAATAAACLAFLIQRQQDAVGLIVFDQAVRRAMAPSTHASHLRQLLHELETTQPDHATDVNHVGVELAERLGRRGLVVLISDLLVDRPGLAQSLRQIRHRGHEVVVLHVLHHDEIEFPFQDNSLFKGMESDHQLMAEPRALRRGYLEAMDHYLAQVRKICADSAIDYVRLSTHEPLDAALAGYLALRQRTQRASRRR